MSLQEFIDKYNGKKNDFDGMYGAQCFDLFQFYNRDVIGGSFVSGNGAVDIWDTYPTNLYTKITNGDTNFPVPGDVMIWGTDYGSYGHVAIVTKADANTFTCLSQNDPAGRETYLKDYSSYFGVLGWLHPIKPIVVDNNTNSNPSMDEKTKRNASYFDRIFYGITSFSWNVSNTDNVSESTVTDFIAWVLDNINRAHLYDLSQQESGQNTQESITIKQLDELIANLKTQLGEKTKGLNECQTNYTNILAEKYPDRLKKCEQNYKKLQDSVKSTTKQLLIKILDKLGL